MLSYPFFLVHVNYKTLARSNVCKDTQNPEWLPCFLESSAISSNLTDLFNIDVQVDMTIYDWDPDGGHDQIGTVTFTLRELFLKSPFFPIIGKRHEGELLLSCVPVYQAATTDSQFPAYKLTCSGLKLAKMDSGPKGKSDPYFTVRKSTGELIYRSEIIKQNLNPSWNPFVISTQEFQFRSPIEVSVFDWDEKDAHDLIGYFVTSLYELSMGEFQYPLVRKGSTTQSLKIEYGKEKSYGSFSVNKMEGIPGKDVALIPLAAQLSFKCIKLPKMDSGPKGKTDAYFIITPQNIDVNVPIHWDSVIYKSEIVYKKLSPVFKPVMLSMNQVGGVNQTFYVVLYDYDPDGTHDYIGKIPLTWRELSFGPFSFGIQGSSRGSFVLSEYVPYNSLDLYPDPWKILPPAIRLTIRGQKFTRMDGPLAKCDPFFKITRYDSTISKNRTVYRSEVIKKSLSPEWKEFELPIRGFISSMTDPIEIDVYDWDVDGTHDFMGKCKINLRTLTFSWAEEPIIDSKGNSKGALVFSNIKHLSDAFVTPTPSGVEIHCSANKLSRTDGMMKKSDPYFEITALVNVRSKKNAENILIYRSEVIRNTLNPVWNPFTLSVAELGGLDKPFTVRVIDYDPDGEHDEIGSFSTTLREYTFGGFQTAILSGGSSKGAFSIDEVYPLAFVPPKLFANAYRVGATASKLTAKDGPLGKSDPFFEVKCRPCTGYQYSLRSSGATITYDQLSNHHPSDVICTPQHGYQEILLYRSEVIKKSLNPIWKEFELDLEIIGGEDEPFTVTVYDWDLDGTHDVIGSFTTTFREWSFGPYQNRICKSSGSSAGGFNIDYTIPIPAAMKKIPPVAVKIEASANKLKRMDGGITGKSDPFLEIIARPPGFTSNITLYRSEVIKKNLNPKWNPFFLNLSDLKGFDTPFTVRVLDWDENGCHDLIGTLTTTLRSWTFGSYQQALKEEGKERSDQNSAGAFSVDFVTPLPQEFKHILYPAFEFGPGARKLRAMDGIGKKSDPFFELIVKEGYSEKVFFRSPFVIQDLNPVWPPLSLNVADFGGYDKEFKIRVWDWDADGEHDLIGEVTTTFREWVVTNGSYQLGLTNGSKETGAFSIDWMRPLQTSVNLPIPFLPAAPAYTLSAFAMKLKRELLSDGVKSHMSVFFEVRCRPPGFSYDITIYRSEISEDETRPSWKPFVINTQDVRGLDTPFTINCYVYHQEGDHRLIGSNSGIKLRDLLYGWWCGPLRKPGSSNSQGGFCFQAVEPLAGELRNYFFPAYRISSLGLKLASKDKNGKSDPFFRISTNTSSPITVYRSEFIKKTCDPTWKAYTLNVQDFGGFDTNLTVSVYDWDKDGTHDLIGTATLTMRDLTFAWFSTQLKHPGHSGTQGAFVCNNPVGLPIPEYQNISYAYEISTSAVKLDGKKGLGPAATSDPYFTIRAQPRGFTRPILLHRSKVVSKSLEPKWDPFVLTMDDVVSLDTPFSIAVYDFNKDGDHELIGEAKTTFREWTLGPYQHALHTKDQLTDSSCGAFSVDFMQPVVFPPGKKSFSPAYKIKAGGRKLSSPSILPNSSPTYFFEVISKPSGFNYPITLYRSEVAEKSNDPDWNEFVLNFSDIRGADNDFIVKVWDWNDDGDHKLIGSLTTTFREWTFGEFRQSVIHPDSGAQGAFAILDIAPLDAAHVHSFAPAYQVSVSAKKIGGLLSKSPDPYFEVSVHVPGRTSPLKLYRSEWLGDNKSPEFAPFVLNLNDIRGLDNEFVISMFDYEKDGEHKPIGELRTTFRQWVFGRWAQPLYKDRSVFESSCGVFYVNAITPLPAASVKVSAPAYRIYSSGSKLERMNALGLGKADPFFEVWSQPRGYSQSVILYRSEVVHDTLSPEWTPFDLDSSSLDEAVVIKVFDYNTDGEHNLIGSVTTTFREFSFKWFSTSLHRSGSLTGGSKGAFSVVKAEPLPTKVPVILPFSPAFTIKPRGRKLEGRDGIGKKSDPYFEIHGKGYHSSDEKLVYRSRVVPSENNPEWDTFVLNTDDVGGFDANFTITVWDRDEDGTNDMIGKLSTNLRHLSLKWFSEQLRRDNKILDKSSGAFALDSIAPCPKSEFLFAPAYSVELIGRKFSYSLLPTASASEGDPFFEIRHNLPGTNKKVLLYRSEVKPLTNKPDWTSFPINVHDVGGIDSPFTVDVYQRKTSGHHNHLGSVTATLRELIWYYYTSLPGSKGGFGVKSITPIPQIVPPAHNPLTKAYMFTPSAVDLAKMDGPLSKSDPFFKILIRNKFTGQPVTVYRSEYIKNTLEPGWKPFILNVDDVGGMHTTFTVAVYDYDDDGGHMLIGKCDTTLQEWLFGWSSQALSNPNSVSTHKGSFIVNQTTPLSDQQLKLISPAYQVTVCAAKLKKKHLIDISNYDVFFIISAQPPGFLVPVTLYRSEVVKDNMEPKFAPFVLNISDLRGIDSPFVVTFFHYRPNGAHMRLGSVETTFREWTFGSIRQAISRDVSPLPPTPVAHNNAPIGVKMVENKASPSANEVHSAADKELNETLDTVKKIAAAPALALALPFFAAFTIIEKPLSTIAQSIDTAVQSIGKSEGALVLSDCKPLDAEKRDIPYGQCIEIEACGIDLDSKDAGGKSDPYFEVKMQPVGFSFPITVYRSEIISKELNPKWKPFALSVEALGSIDTPFEISVWDHDDDGSNDLIGKVSTTLREWMFGPFSVPLINEAHLGRMNYKSSGGFAISKITNVTPDKIKPFAPAYKITVSGSKLERKDGLLGKSDPYFIIKKQYPGLAKPLVLYRSEYIKDTLSPEWNSFILNMHNVGGPDSGFSVEVWDFDSDGGHDMIGEFVTTLREWSLGTFTHKIVNKKKVGRLGYQSSGGFNMLKAEPLDQPQNNLLPPAVLLTVAGAKLDGSATSHHPNYFFEIKNRTTTGSLSPLSLESVANLVYRSPMVEGSHPSWKSVGLTAAVVGGLDTEFEITFYQHDKRGLHELIGTCTTTYRELVCNPFRYSLIDPEKQNRIGYQSSGALCIESIKGVTEQEALSKMSFISLAPPTGSYVLQVAGHELERKDIGGVGKSDPFFEVHKSFPGFPNPIVLYRSTHLNNSSSPTWPPFELRASAFTGVDERFTIKVFDYDSDGTHDLIGQFDTTLRNLMHGYYCFSVVNPKKKGRIGYSNSGAFILQSLSVSDVCKLPVISHGLQITCKGISVKSKGKGTFLEAWVKPQPNTSVRNPTPWLLYRSEKIEDNKNPMWKSFPAFVSIVGSQFEEVEIRVFDWISVGNGVKDYIGSCSFTLAELTIGPFVAPIVDPSNGLPGYKSSGGFEIIVDYINTPPITFPATAYRVQCHVEEYPLKGDDRSSPITSLKITGKRLLGKKPAAVLFETKLSQNINWDIVVPFEGCGVAGPFAPLTFDYYDGEFVASLYELSLPDAAFHFIRIPDPDKKNKIFKRNHAGKLVIDSVTPILHYWTQLEVTVRLEDLDMALDSGQEPFIKITHKNNAIYTSELLKKEVTTTFVPFVLNVPTIGDLDEEVSLECWAAVAPVPYFIGRSRFTLRELILAFRHRAGELLLIDEDRRERSPLYSNSGLARILNVAEVPQTTGTHWFQFLPIH
eukprot:TRINITY_DN5524_c0_g1_i1.p1 TRINITY_DN5524_c0_g1~~TRINITY_DN5524_c0_g1_i1.p1  ORF type:complete len:3569 (+),score=897.31 TRINITY_DN5524_c0_g1_i1:81-10787(+)